MPDLGGASLTDAQSELLALGLLDMKFAYKRSGGPPGTVIAQSPAAGDPLPAGTSRVKLTVVEAKPGDPCDKSELAAAEIGGELYDCDPAQKQVVSHGMECEGSKRSGILGNLECDPSRICGGYSQWTSKGRREPCELGKPVPSPGLAPPQEGDPCVPGQPVPIPGLVCKPAE